MIAVLEGEDIILAQITSKGRYDRYAIEIKREDFSLFQTKLESFIEDKRKNKKDERN